MSTRNALSPRWPTDYICQKRGLTTENGDGKRGVPAEIAFHTKAEIALAQIRRARERGIPEGVVLADAGYGTDTGFRAQLTKMALPYVMGIMSTVTVWKPGQGPKPPTGSKGTGRPPSTAAARPTPSAGCAQRTGAFIAGRCVERRGLAARSQQETPVAVGSPPGSSSSSRLLASRAACGRVAAHRMAEGGIRTDQVLAIHLAGGCCALRASAPGQAPLDHRTRLSGTQARTGARAL